MFSAEQPEFFLDRSLGRTTATRLREAGYVVHLIADHYPDDASDVPDEEWIAEGCAQGWVLLTKDKRIRFRADELEALQEGHLLLGQRQRRHRRHDPGLPWCAPKDRGRRQKEPVGFWHVYRDGQIKRMWP